MFRNDARKGDTLRAVMSAPKSYKVDVAAAACKVDRRVLDDGLKHGRFPNAFRDEGHWMIPEEDLTAAGFKLDSRWVRSRNRYLRNRERIKKQAH
jgi:hypothetical protein